MQLPLATWSTMPDWRVIEPIRHRYIVFGNEYSAS